MPPWKKLSSAFKKAIDLSKMQPEPSEPSPSTKAEDLLAFCMITMMLSFIQSTTGQLGCTATTTAPLGTKWEDRRLLRILDALSTVLVRKHKIITVMVKPYDGSDVQVLASMVQPSNEPLLHPSNESLLQSGANSDSQSFMRWMLSNFTVAWRHAMTPYTTTKILWWIQAHFHVFEIMKIRFLRILLQPSNREWKCLIRCLGLT